MRVIERKGDLCGFCPVCNTRITRPTGWRLHHCVPHVMGGSRSVENRVLLHPECLNRVPDQCIAVSKPHLPKEAVEESKGLRRVR